MKLFSSSIAVALVFASVKALRVKSADQIDSQFSFGSLLDKGAASLTSLAGGAPDVVKNIGSQFDNLKKAAEKGNVSDLIGAGGQLGSQIGGDQIAKIS